MMGNLYKNKNSKFSLWAKRLVWEGPDANAAIEGAITEAQRSETTKTPAEILEVAEENLLAKKPTDYEENVESKDAYDKALLAVRAANAKYEKVAKDLATKVALTARLAAVDPSADILHADEELKAIEQKNIPLPDTMKVDVSGKRGELNTAATPYYNGKQAVEWFDVDNGTVKEGEGGVTNDKCRAVMADVAEMQQAKLTGFPGLADDAKTAMNTAYILRINAGLAWLNANNGAMTADEQKGLRDFDRAKSNWDAAQQSKETQHKAGAEQYFGMILAEQEARRVWQKLPGGETPANSWRSTTDILTPLTDEAITEGWSDNPDVAALYQEAVVLFNKARQMSVVSQENRDKAGKVYMDATAVYKQAADKFRGVLADLNSRVKAIKENEVKEKREEAKKLITSIDTPWALGLPEYAKIKGKINGQDEISSEQLEADLKRLKELKTAWESLKKTFQEKLNASATHIEGDLGDGNDVVDISKVVNDYLAPENMELDELQQKMFRGSPSLHKCVLTLTYKSPDGSMQKRTAEAKYSNGIWEANYINESNGGSGNSGAEGAPPVS